MHALLICLCLFFVRSCAAHMEMSKPAPLGSKGSDTPDPSLQYSYTTPLAADGSNFPCLGMLKYYDQANPTGTYNPGDAIDVAIAGGATHNGGSCQFALSYDQGKSFMVIASVIGGCPTTNTYSIKIPSNAPPSDKVIFAWFWLNYSGNRELYNNCALIKIGGSGAGFEAPAAFLANIFNGDDACKTKEGINFAYPNPGQVVIGGPGTSQDFNCPKVNNNLNLKVDGSGKMAEGANQQIVKPSVTQPNTGASNQASSTANNGKYTGNQQKQKATSKGQQTQTQADDQENGDSGTETTTAVAPENTSGTQNFEAGQCSGFMRRPKQVVFGRRLKKRGFGYFFRHVIQ